MSFLRRSRSLGRPYQIDDDLRDGRPDLAAAVAARDEAHARRIVEVWRAGLSEAGR